LAEGCTCDPWIGDKELKVGDDCDSGCSNKEEIKERGPSMAYIWKDHYLCAEYFTDREYTNIFA
jgi:hypothetical protein